MEQGRSGGGLCYGYDVVRTTDAAGEPVRGGRRIDEGEAAIVRRVFREFAAGVGPRAIARRLNDEGVPGPSGKLWTDSTLRGHARRGTGLINNELYIGRLIWNRLRYVKNPDTGRRVSRINPPEEWIVTEAPELRIVGDALWRAVKDRQSALSARYATVIEATRAARANRLNATHRPRHLLSGLLECGVCGGSYAMRGQDRYGCSNHVMNGSCANGRGIARSILEGRVLAGLKDRLMAPEAAAEAMRAYAEETNRLNRERRASGESDRKELAGVEKKIADIVAAIEDGGYTRALTDRLRELEARQDELRERLATAPADIPDVHPNVAGLYRRKVERLAEALRDSRERDEAAEAVRGLIERVVLTPGAKRGEMDATLHGDLGAILEWTAKGHRKNETDTPSSEMSVSAVARGGGGGGGRFPARTRAAPAPPRPALTASSARTRRPARTPSPRSSCRAARRRGRSHPGPGPTSRRTASPWTAPAAARAGLAWSQVSLTDFQDTRGSSVSVERARSPEGRIGALAEADAGARSAPWT